ncbi:MAG: radical SAM protein [Nanoarchaeota archaeon]
MLSKQSPVTLVELPATQFGELNGDSSYDVYSMFGLPSRAIHTLEAVLRQEGWSNVQCINPLYHGKKGKLTKENEERIKKSAVLGISAITRTSPQSMALAQQYKQANPHGIVIAGGFDPMARPAAWLEQGADIVGIGEGERTLVELMARLEQDQYVADIHGIAYRNGKSLTITPPRQLLSAAELGEIPHPHYDAMVRKKVNVGVIESSRGCPHDCDFCSVTQAYGREYRTKPTEYVLEGLRDIEDMGKTVFFADDNLAGSPKRTIALLESMAAEGLPRKNATAQVTVWAAKNPALLQAMKKAGITLLCIGIESIFDESLDSLGKPYNAAQNKESIKLLREEGFWVHGMMMPGAEGDTKERLKETSHWINENLDSVQLFPPTPIPGTRLFKRMEEEGRILTHDYSLYDGQNVLIRPSHMTPYDLQLTINQMYLSFYSAPRSIRRIASSSHKKTALGIFFYTTFLGGIRKVLDSPQSLRHLEFLKSIS